MASKQATLIHVDEDYIDMELCSSPNFFSYSNREFEFQMTCISTEKDSSTSPADDLFYKGKLLPLHLPPRLQMVQNLIENSNANFEYVKSEPAFENRNFAFTSDLRVPSTNATTPLESFSILPSESHRVSSDLSSNEYRFGWSSDMNGFVGDLPKKSWPKKLKQMKQFWLSQRLKASRAYLKALFNKSGCSDKCCASAANNMGAEKKSKCNDSQNKYIKVSRRNPFENFYDNKHQLSCAVMKTIERDMLEDDSSNYRRSFSGVGQRHCATKASYLSTSSSGSSSSSSSFSFSSAGCYDLQLFKRSISANYELESAIEGAIAHCKQSQHQCGSKNASDGSRICSQFETKMQSVGVKK
ncbi:probable membrane-associated kinase regulator 4 [Abrus precatorius]|uniref:Probable membrane-associated kinase regulator 4 n=1 Tax=Abrus precatorius TaxID=3816 RepID=A0A8B8MKI2_ABRPR|nr:probable membrane-associated kinase regulator 4 [Abrus precatorius]